MGLKLRPTHRTRQAVGGQRIKVAEPSKTTITEERAQELLAERRAARQRKDYRRADEIRDYLAGQGFVIEDTGTSP